MPSQFQNPTHIARIGYNGFNMSHTLKFTSTCGELLPVYYDILQPGDKVSMRAELKTRTMPLQTAAMTRLTEHIEWFYVPITQIYSTFDSFYYGIQDVRSSLVEPRDLQKYFPFYTAADFTTAYVNAIQAVDNYFGAELDMQGQVIPLVGTKLRLMELLGIPIPNVNMHDVTTYTYNMGISPILACAYQKIYYDYYRDPEREPNNPKNYNLDMFYLNPQIPDNSLRFFTLRYRRWKPDFFIHRYTSPLFGAQSIGSAGASSAITDYPDLTKSFQQWLTATNFNTFGVGAWTSGSSAPPTPNPNGRGEMAVNNTDPTQVAPDGLNYSTSSGLFTHGGNIQQALSPTSIRTSFAVQKLLEVTRRAGKHFDRQQLAHFGVDVPQGVNGECTLIGHQESDLVIGDVISTAATTDASLGEVGGKGYNYTKGSGMKFTAPTHGILMAIYSAEPNVDYSQYGLDYLNCLMDRSDWPTPEFDNLGMQPLFKYQSHFDFALSTNSDVLGWKYRYFPFKQKYNRVVGGLRDDRSLYSWTTSREHVYNNVQDFYISPFYLNSILEKGYEFDGDASNYDTLYDSDPLLHEIYFDVKKSSKMSAYGLEQL